MDFLFNDGNSICLFKDGKVQTFESDFVHNYQRNMRKSKDRDAWKSQGFGAKFRGDSMSGVFNKEGDAEVKVSVNGLAFEEEDKIFYSVSINEMSGIFRKDLGEKDASESHVIHASDMEFFGLDYHAADNTLAASVRLETYAQSVAIFDGVTHDYSVLTGGDSKDEAPSFSQSQKDVVWFSSAGIGRDNADRFVQYGESGLYTLNLFDKDIKEVLFKEKKSLVHPKEDSSGNLYYIERPTGKPVKVGSMLIDVLLIPVRFVHAIFNFFEFFTVLFTGKGFSDKTGGNNPAKGKDVNAGKVFIDGNLVDADKTYKENERKKNDYAGIVPDSWQLIKREKDGTETVLAKSVISFDLLPSGGLLYTNGRHIVKIEDGKKEKLCSTKLCTKVAVRGNPPPEGTKVF